MMASSTNVVNFSLRQNKAIERSIVFDGLQEVYRRMSISNMVYIGLGSIWFADFQIAHRQLGIVDMVSLESDDMTFQRAVFNKPYRTIELVHGRSDEVLREVLDRGLIAHRPTIVWLDYDECLDATKVTELTRLTSTLPANSFLIATFNVRANSYAKVREREESLKNLFQDSYEDFGLDLGIQDQFMLAVGHNLEGTILSAASRCGREAHGVPAFFLPYRDSTPMLTIGVFLPTENTISAAMEVLSDDIWAGRTDRVIATPHLTAKE